MRLRAAPSVSPRMRLSARRWRRAPSSAAGLRPSVPRAIVRDTRPSPATAGRTAAGRQAPPYPLGRAAAPRAAARRLRETGASYLPAAVDLVDLAGLIVSPREIDDEIGDLLRRAATPYRLARDERRKRRIVQIGRAT